jgi:hypothetical protein
MDVEANTVVKDEYTIEAWEESVPPGDGECVFDVTLDNNNPVAIVLCIQTQVYSFNSCAYAKGIKGEGECKS